MNESTTKPTKHFRDFRSNWTKTNAKSVFDYSHLANEEKKDPLSSIVETT